ncbi:MAG: sigma-54-dependent transcriptional regulator [Thermoanaerobaculia bacterium]
METVLLVEDKESLATMVREAIEPEGFEVEWVASGSEAMRRIGSGRRWSLILTDLRLPGADGIEILRAAKDVDSQIPVIVMTAYGTIEQAVEAMKLGAWDFIQKPVDIDYLILLMRRAVDHRALRSENLLLKEEFQKRFGLPAIVGDSAPLQEVSRQIQKVAPTDSSVLLMGESGTGKELFARAIHSLSNRNRRPFVAINCAAIPDTLIENELFGHEKGAYTGAGSRQVGKFELAHGGTVFLDEIGELALSVQSKVLRVIQERKFDRIGGSRVIEVDVRIICATNRNLEAAVREGRFRDDLFFRINVFPVTIPPLRARKEDLDPLARYFADRFGREFGREPLSISEDAWEAIRSYDWPGNIRELENAIERAAILCEGSVIVAADLRLGPSAGRHSVRDTFDLSGTLEQVGSKALEIVERAKIEEILKETSDRQGAAERLGISVRALAARLRQYDMENE